MRRRLAVRSRNRGRSRLSMARAGPATLRLPPHDGPLQLDPFALELLRVLRTDDPDDLRVVSLRVLPATLRGQDVREVEMRGGRVRIVPDRLLEALGRHIVAAL